MYVYVHTNIQIDTQMQYIQHQIRNDQWLLAPFKSMSRMLPQSALRAPPQGMLRNCSDHHASCALPLTRQREKHLMRPSSGLSNNTPRDGPLLRGLLEASLVSPMA